MTVGFNTDLLNRHIAPGISDFKACDAPDITDAHPEAEHWLANHFLNSVFRAGFKGRIRQYALNQIFRAQSAFHDYHEARGLTHEFLAKGSPDHPASRLYFRAVARWESCFLNLQIFIDVMNKMKQDFKDEPVFKADDGTPEQRAYVIANTIKHWGSDIANDRHSDGDTIPLWLTNTGFQTRLHSLTYPELGKLVSEVATIADELQDPKSFAEAK
jgi:hypothetical protein